MLNIWFYGFILLSTISSIANSLPIEVSRPKALISDAEHTEPYLVLKNFQPNNHILIKVSTPFILPDPDKENLRDSYLQKNGYRVETTATPQYYISSIKPTRRDYYYPQFPETVDIKDQKELYLVQMQPPAENQNEPNYYAKVKKDSKRKKYDPNQKHINYKEYIPKTEITAMDSVEVTQVNQQQDMISTEASDYVNVQAAGPLIQKPTLKPLTSAELNTGEYLPSPLKRAADESDRVEYQMHGFNGPQSYKFGYDTGKGKNRQYRVEQRDKDGNVKGQYGYYDNDGKMNIVKYTSSANGGFISELTS